jgi:fructan beta-fructosidase
VNHINPATNPTPVRPLFHFTPAANWINDPNGLVYYAGEYHLFYQYHPHSTVWGPMHWGHAVSTDLLHWEALPIALYPDELGTIFSGSAVIDWQNSAGFGAEAMVAIFTHDAPVGQRQSLAYSTDRGRTWTKYAGNPVIATPQGEKDFRDPKVFWYTDGSGNGHWVMLLAVADSIWFYTSPNLIDWRFASEFGEGHGSHAGVWETPDLFNLVVDEGPARRWVLSVGVGSGATVDEQGTQYFVGAFDGYTFTNDNPPSTLLRADAGPDFYAAQGWNDTPDGRKLWLAWMNNWIYANQIPTGSWRGAMSIPRELRLATTPAGLRLVQQPIPELAKQRGRPYHGQSQTIAATEVRLADTPSGALEVLVKFTLVPEQPATVFGLHLDTAAGERTTIGYTVDTERLFIDRTRSGQIDFNAAFATRYEAPLTPADGVVRLHLLIDQTSIELFGNDGLAALTAQIFPTNQQLTITLFAQEGIVHLSQLDLWPLVL